MEEIIQNPLSWFSFISISLLLLVIQQLAVVGSRFLHNFMLFGRTRIPLADLAQKMLVVLEPLIFVLIIGLFVAIHPLFNGMAIVLISAVTFLQLRDYLSGRIILYTTSIMHDKKISAGNFSGSVVKTGKLGLHIRTAEGVLYLNYYRLISEGFTLSAGEELGDYCTLVLSSKSPETKPKEIVRRLNEILLTLPYIDWKYRPKITTSNQISGEVELKLLLHENITTEEMVRYFTDADYNCVPKKI
ncbi:MAG: hypothetical protein WC384_02810 [Prolixibacteraceae bacterium]|jgi:hypothetical protein